MKHVVGIDGGGTKTRCLVGDLQGNILGDHTLGASNHQTAGRKQARAIIEEVYKKALDQAGIKDEDIHYVFLGLAGADLPSDFRLLNKWCAGIFGDIPFQVVNDAWISMRSGLKGTWGAVSICGTGANAGACHPDGRRIILNALSYELGNYGGGGHITEKALHYAFRAHEGTSCETTLTKELPKLLGARDMGDLLSKFYPQTLISDEDLREISPLVFRLAGERDGVCQRILIEMGHVLGEMASGVIRRLGMEDMEVPVVLGGSIYRGNNPLLVDEFTTTLHTVVPGARPVIPSMPPVAGAYLSALDSLKLVPGPAVYENLESHFSKILLAVQH